MPGFDDRRRGQTFDCAAQREMNGNRDNAQSRAHQHHDRNPITPRQLGKVFGMSGMMKTGPVKAFLVDRVRNERSSAPAANIADSGLDRAQDGGRVARIRAARLGPDGVAHRHDRERVVEYKQCPIRSVDRPDRHGPAKLLG